MCVGSPLSSVLLFFDSFYPFFIYMNLPCFSQPPSRPLTVFSVEIIPPWASLALRLTFQPICFTEISRITGQPLLSCCHLCWVPVSQLCTFTGRNTSSTSSFIQDIMYIWNFHLRCGNIFLMSILHLSLSCFFRVT